MSAPPSNNPNPNPNTNPNPDPDHKVGNNLKLGKYNKNYIPSQHHPPDKLQLDPAVLIEVLKMINMYGIDQGKSSNIDVINRKDIVLYLSCILCGLITQDPPISIQTRETASKILKVKLKNDNIETFNRACVWRIFISSLAIYQPPVLRPIIAIIFVEFNSNSAWIHAKLIPLCLHYLHQYHEKYRAVSSDANGFRTPIIFNFANTSHEFSSAIVCILILERLVETDGITIMQSFTFPVVSTKKPDPNPNPNPNPNTPPPPPKTRIFSLLCYLISFFYSPFDQLRTTGLCVIQSLLRDMQIKKEEGSSLMQAMYALTTSNLVPSTLTTDAYTQQLMQTIDDVNVFPKELVPLITSYIPITTHADYQRVSQILSRLVVGTAEQQLLLPQLDHWVKILIDTMCLPEDAVALEAAEFFSAMCEHGFPTHAIVPHLAPIVDRLLTNMEKQDFKIELIEEDIKKEKEKKKDDEDEDIGDQEWNKRKASASSLDTMAVRFGKELFHVAIPVIRKRLKHKEWYVRESAILGLGAITEGCQAELHDVADEFLSVLLLSIYDDHYFVRRITCWVVGRFSESIVRNKDDSKYLTPFLKGLVKRMFDTTIKVQYDAISGLSTLIEKAKSRINPHLKLIIENTMNYFNMATLENIDESANKPQPRLNNKGYYSKKTKAVDDTKCQKKMKIESSSSSGEPSITTEHMSLDYLNNTNYEEKKSLSNTFSDVLVIETKESKEIKGGRLHIGDLTKTKGRTMKKKIHTSPLLHICDLISSLTDVADHKMLSQYINQIFPPLFALFQHVNITTVKYASPFLDTLSSLMKPFGRSTFTFYGTGLWNKTWNALETLRIDPRADMGVVVSGLDLICGMIEAYRQDCLPLIISIDLIANLPPYLQIMEADVMATAWAIAGESGKSCPASIEASQVQTLVQLGLHALAQRDIKIINNVSWALGHIARAVGPEVFRPYFSSCIDTFSILLTGTFQSLDGAIILPPTVCGNIAITIFLFSEMAPDTVIGHMNKEILPIWLHGLKSIDFEKKSDNDDDEMKESELVVDRVGILMKSQIFKTREIGVQFQSEWSELFDHWRSKPGIPQRYHQEFDNWKKAYCS